ncbi:hypothetical protein HMPREF0762_01594 [Slackia exigua ATCC 700122]|uniref:Uncharacterized protein n=1 Tax=Slackia exigua (strain ATCC 700122 / DSM 15923 / CIP 105133 / JCM 11022 / KCTC 5966 / S-7) TaxID=649764 RepID=D0WIB9_SLAES|nr:hypothetical protein HMPREF0762_01594 [Slackia exigua ATCC 700122]
MKAQGAISPAHPERLEPDASSMMGTIDSPRGHGASRAVWWKPSASIDIDCLQAFGASRACGRRTSRFPYRISRSCHDLWVPIVPLHPDRRRRSGYP